MVISETTNTSNKKRIPEEKYLRLVTNCKHANIYSFLPRAQTGWYFVLQKKYQRKKHSTNQNAMY